MNLRNAAKEKMTQQKNEYDLGFTSASLMLNESDALIYSIQNPKDFMKGTEDVDIMTIPTNSEASKVRLLRELTKRVRKLNNELFIKQYIDGNKLDRSLILFYASCKTYPIIGDFMLERVLNKWYNLDKELLAYDFESFLYNQVEKHEELNKLTTSTIRKLAQVTIRMMNELGILDKNTLQKLDYDKAILKSIVRNGDSWFLETLFLTENERIDILNS